MRLSLCCAAALAGTASVCAVLDKTHGTFQQNGEVIERFADTNTMEEYVHDEPRSDENNQKSALRGPKKSGSLSDAANEQLNIFLLPHSHDDPGWVRTSDQYFDFFVNDIYTTAVAALAEDSRRKFQAVEMIYFSKWYDGASPEQQQLAQTLVANGQLQFAVGGWAMPDEATTDYPDIIETMTTGHQWLLDTFGEVARPRFGFQVDPFGASSAFAALSALMGFNGHIVARLNYFDKGWMQDNKQLEFVWRPDADWYAARGDDAAIFTHIMDQFQYSSPGIPLQAQLDNLCALSNQTDCPGGGFFWDGDDSSPAWWWSEQQQQQGYSAYPAVNSSNVEFYSDFMVNSSRSRAEWFRSPNLLWCFGTDFQWFNASEMFYSMDQIVDYIEARNGAGQRYEGVTIQYGMLEDYFSAVHEWSTENAATIAEQSGAPVDWSVRDDGDFLPYNTLNCAGASQTFNETCSGNAGPQFEESWPQTWSGFFTSHMGLKLSMRRKSEQLRASKALLATAAWQQGIEQVGGSTEEQQPWNSAERLNSAISGLRSSVGLLTHHDSQTGTMGPGCGNGDTSHERRRVVHGLWGASDASSTSNFLMSADDALDAVRLGRSESDSDTCPYLPMGAFGNAGAVDADYEYRLEEGWRALAPTVSQAAYDLLTSNTSADTTEASHLEMDSQQLRDNLLSDGTGTVTVFNPLGWTLNRWVAVEVPEGKYSVRLSGSDDDATPVLFDMMPAGALDCASSHHHICEKAQQRRGYSAANAGQSAGDEAVANAVMYIRVEVPPLGLQTFTLEYHGYQPVNFTSVPVPSGLEEDASSNIAFGNHFFRLIFSSTSGKLKAIRDLTQSSRHDGRVAVTQSLYEYDSFSAFDNYSSPDGWNLGYTGARSGSYLLHSNSASPGSITDAFDRPTLSFVSSEAGYVQELRQQFSPTATQVWRLYGGHATDPDTNAMAAGFVDYFLAVGPLAGNKEHVTLFDASKSINTVEGKTGSTFQSDNNGLLMQQRTYSANRTLPDGTVTKVAPDDTYELALNYYPIVRSANIQETSDTVETPKKFTLLSAQAGAVTSRSSGQLEVMVMRKSLQDDSKGACQVFNDTTGQYATIPNDPSEGTSCEGYASMGTCRPDACPSYAIPMNISERVITNFWVLTGPVSAVEQREQIQAQVLNNPPLLFYGLAGNDSSSFAEWPSTVAPLGDGNALPDSIHLLNLGVRVNTSGAPNAQAPPQKPMLVLRVQNIANDTATLGMQDSGLCNLLGLTSTFEERSVSTIWPLSGAGALSRWTWNTVERSDDTVDLNRLNQAPSSSGKRRSHDSAAAPSSTLSAELTCSSASLDLAKRDLRTFYVSS